MKAISLFSGVGGMDLGFERAGIETVLQCEIDPWCRGVLERHWPEVERIEDVSHVTGKLAEQLQSSDGSQYVDLVYGGFPCQDLSVAGNRAGLGGARSGLFWELIRVVRELRAASHGRAPGYVVVENVRGLYSSGSGRDFATVLNSLAECGAVDLAWRTLDAQHWVPQRRRRVFIVAVFPPVADGGAGIGTAAEILALTESGDGHPAPSRTAGEGVAYARAASAQGTGDGHGQAWNTTYIPDVSPPLVAGEHKTGGPRSPNTWNTALLAAGLADSQRGEVLLTDTAHPLTTGGGKPGQGYGAVMVGRALTAPAHGPRYDDMTEDFITFGYQSEGDLGSNPSSTSTQALQVKHAPALAGAFGVRRLTPRECERLQGWEDDHTRWTADGREVPDSIRYRMVGNGVASPVAEYIGRRLVAVDERLRR